MFILKNISTWTAESRIVLRTSARLSRRRMEVAKPEMDFMSMSTSVPNSSDSAVMNIAAI